MEERTLHLLDYASILNRRRTWLVVPLVACVLVGVALAYLLPAWYMSQSTIGLVAPTVQPDVIGKGYSASTVQAEREERARAIAQQVLSPQVLERVAREEQLAVDGPIDKVAAKLRQNITVVPADLIARPSSRQAGLDTFQLQYLDRTPEQAQRIAERLAKVFVDEHSRQREVRAEYTAAFLAGQLRESQEKLTALEAQLRERKERFMGRLPEQRDANLQMVAGLRQQLEANSNALRGEQDRLTMIERQLEAMRIGGGDAAVPRAVTGPVGAHNRIADLQRQLADAKAMYTEKHPEIQRLQEELAAARLEAQQARSQPSEERLEGLQGDPAYQQLVADRNMARLRVQTLQRAEASARAQIGDYQNRVEVAPRVEQELASLTREYELERQQYGKLSGDHQAALVREDLERRQGGERFSVLTAANRPDAPSWPNRGRVLLISIGLGLCLGFGLAGAREYLDRSVHDARAIQQEFQIPVLAEIPRIARVVPNEM
jgi:polysaccharide chain length determinant protein (PEP-CTERM system associated)